MLPFSTPLEEDFRETAHRDTVERLIVGAVVFHPNEPDRILVLERAAGDFMGGIEELPSGKVEESESFAQALTREVLEETGLTITGIEDFLWSFDYRSQSGRLTRQFNFVVKTADAPVRLNPEEHSGFRWLRLDDIHQSRLTANVIQLLERL